MYLLWNHSGWPNRRHAATPSQGTSDEGILSIIFGVTKVRGCGEVKTGTRDSTTPVSVLLTSWASVPTTIGSFTRSILTLHRCIMTMNSRIHTKNNAMHPNEPSYQLVRCFEIVGFSNLEVFARRTYDLIFSSDHQKSAGIYGHLINLE